MRQAGANIVIADCRGKATCCFDMVETRIMPSEGMFVLCMLFTQKVFYLCCFSFQRNYYKANILSLIPFYFNKKTRSVYEFFEVADYRSFYGIMPNGLFRRDWRRCR
ncbi:MAG: hypothetical protein IJ734_00165, partial [Fibrobacter sp.]|nr:hypothetical protein [Fibrobacter sp.]